jgi:ABC-type dipeptide/oligopeptide/nickel transport system permease component
MKILGPTMEKNLVQVIFWIIMVLYTIFIATQLIATILVENISGASALREESLERLRQNLTGSATMDRAQNSRRI